VCCGDFALTDTACGALRDFRRVRRARGAKLSAFPTESAVAAAVVPPASGPPAIRVLAKPKM